MVVVPVVVWVEAVRVLKATSVAIHNRASNTRVAVEAAARKTMVKMRPAALPIAMEIPLVEVTAESAVMFMGSPGIPLRERAAAVGAASARPALVEQEAAALVEMEQPVLMVL